MVTTGSNPYLTGVFAPVSEEVTVADLPVTGVLPDALTGRYLRNGPNPIGQPDPATYHWFSGHGMVHGIRLEAGRATWYRNRWVRNTEVAGLLGEDPKPGPIHSGMDFAANTNVIAHAGRTLAIVEAGALPYELTYELDTVGPTDFDGTLHGGYTAHPKKDPVTGELHAVSYFWGWGNQVRYSVTGTDGRVRKGVDIPVGGMVSIHDLSITERYAVIYDLPLVFSADALTEGFQFPYRWTDDYEPRVGLLDRDGDAVGAGADAVTWVPVDPCYVFHPMNAFDDGDAVVVDLVRHPKVFASHLTGPSEGRPTLERWRIDPVLGKVATEELDDRGWEFPRVDERVVGRRHRYGYAVGVDPDPTSFALEHGIAKRDSERSTIEVRRTGGQAGEAVFVPSSADAGEDDGWVLSLVFDPDSDTSDLLVINAADFTGEPAAVVHLPVRVPVGFHGNWAPDPG